jgi:hypothetical protein
MNADFMIKAAGLQLPLALALLDYENKKGTVEPCPDF